MAAEPLRALESSRYRALLRVLTERQIPFEERPLFTHYGAFGSSVHITLPPTQWTEQSPGIFVLAIPLIGSETGKGLDASEDLLPFSFETALAFVETIRTQGSPLHIQVAFLGDEGSQVPEELRNTSHAGLAELCATLENPENTVLWYLDMPTAPEKLLIHHGAARTITALNVLQPIGDFHNIPYSFAVPYNGLYLSGLVHGPEVLRLARGINALYLTGSGTGQVQAEALGEALVAYTAGLRITTENLDYHYSIFDFRGKYVFISELLTVLALLLIAAVCLLAFLSYSALHHRILVIHWRIFFHRSWVLLVFLGILVLTLELARFLMLVFPPIEGDFYQVLFQLVIALLLFYLLAPLVDTIRISGKTHFYGNAAIILITLGTLIAACINITFIPLFIGALLFTFLGSALPIPVLVYCCVLLPFLHGLYSVLPIVAAGGRQLAGIILSRDTLVSLYIAVILLPFILIIKRGTALLLGRKPRSPLFRRILLPLVLLIAALGGFVFYVWDVSAVPRAGPVRRTIIENPEILSIKSRVSTFLERRSITISIAARGSPVRFDMYLDTDEGEAQPVYSAPMPFELRQDSVAFILGEGPPNPFTTEIVLPLEFSGSLRVEALYAAWDPTVDTLPPPDSEDYVLQVIRRMPIQRE
jgi:hypothetical protein